MINIKSLEAIRANNFNEHFLRPHDLYSYASIPTIVTELLTTDKPIELQKRGIEGYSKKYDHVILFLIDGFGWQFFEKHAEQFPFLKRILVQGSASAFTAQYPSTTAVELTTLHTGLPVSEHGISEWNMYEPLVDDIISPLPFSYTRDKKVRGTLSGKLDPAAIFPTENIYKNLQKNNVSSFIVQTQAVMPSPFIDTVGAGANVFGFKTLVEGLLQIIKNISQTPSSYTYFYFANIDTMLHKYGPQSKEAYEEMSLFFIALEQVLLKNLKTKNTLLVLTADHGHADINPTTTVYLNQEIKELESWIKRNKEGKLLVPSGNCRNMYLHIEEQHMQSALASLKNLLKGRAEVYTKEELLKTGIFGQKYSEKLSQRLGDIIILPYDKESVWWYEKDLFEVNYFGHHGGLTRNELQIPFLLLSI